MLNKLWDIVAIPLGFIMRLCYQLTNEILHLPIAYVFALFLFTLIVRALMFPLSLKQTRSTAKMSAFKPMMDEIQRKYKDNPQRQQEEMAKLQREYGFSPTAGCLPMLLQFPIMFGLIQVIYKPLKFVLQIPDVVTEALTKAAGIASTDVYAQTTLIEKIHSGAAGLSGVTAEGYIAAEISGFVDKIKGFDMTLGSIKLYAKPSLTEPSLILIIPIISIVTMLFSTWLSTKLSSGSTGSLAKQMLPMMAVSVIMFGVFSFIYPAGFSLYWSMGNVIMILQSLILRKIVDPEKIAAEVKQQIEASKKTKKTKEKVMTVTQDGVTKQVVVKGSELDKMRLLRARERDASRYDD